MELEAEELSLMAAEIAEEVVEAFSTHHPDVKMNRRQWADLMEMIDREVRGSFGPSEARLDGSAPFATDLLARE